MLAAFRSLEIKLHLKIFIRRAAVSWLENLSKVTDCLQTPPAIKVQSKFAKMRIVFSLPRHKSFH